MWPYSELGIEPTDDERAIKRAYAVKLKQNRPDQNPEGFQRLHEAYQAALQRCHAGTPTAAAMPPPAVSRPLPPPVATAAPAPVPARPTTVAAPVSFDADAFLHEAVARADANEPGPLRQWLESHEALWSLSLKTRVGQRWLAVLHHAAPPMPDGCFDEMLAFFRLDHAGAVQDPLLLAQRRQRMHMAWYLAPERRNALAGALGAKTVSARKQTVRSLAWLQQPFGWPVALWRSLLPQTVRTMSNLILRLAGQPPVELPPPVNPRQQAFWLQAAHGGPFTRIGMAIIGARIAGALLLGLLLGVAFGAVAIPDTGHFGWPLVGVMVAIAGGISAVALAFIAWSQLTLWQRRFVPLEGVLGWLHLALVPLLAGAALLVVDASDSPMAGWLLTVPALWLALARVLHGRQVAASLRGWLRLGIFLIYPVASFIANAVQVPVIMGNSLAAAALLAWAIDAWRRLPRRQRALA
ncbi:MAG TPA: J domain-containing protein [Dyella sp.]|nr:J domain-containing protein [Dyella sp.]